MFVRLRRENVLKCVLARIFFHVQPIISLICRTVFAVVIVVSQVFGCAIEHNDDLFVRVGYQVMTIWKTGFGNMIGLSCQLGTVHFLRGGGGVVGFEGFTQKNGLKGGPSKKIKGKGGVT